jgi:hypothetical protein
MLRKGKVDKERVGDPLSRVTLFLLSLQSQLRMYHWQTRSYARHKASDELIVRIVELSDSMIEAFVGLCGGTRPQAVADMPWGLKNLSDLDGISTYFRHVVEFLTTELPALVGRDAALLNIRDEMLTAIYKTQYIFTLS